MIKFNKGKSDSIKGETGIVSHRFFILLLVKDDDARRRGFDRFIAGLGDGNKKKKKIEELL